MIYDYEPVALTVMVTLTGSLSSPGGGAWPVVGVALRGEMVRGEDARGKAMVGPGKDQHQGSASGRRANKTKHFSLEFLKSN